MPSWEDVAVCRCGFVNAWVGILGCCVISGVVFIRQVGCCDCYLITIMSKIYTSVCYGGDRLFLRTCELNKVTDYILNRPYLSRLPLVRIRW